VSCQIRPKLSISPKIAALNASLPSGYHICIGGTVEESNKTQVSVAAALPLMLILILTVLMIQLQSQQMPRRVHGRVSCV
jgi:multidrug efflux pump